MSGEFCGTPGPWVNNNGGVFTEDFAVGDEVFFDHICDCEVINGESHNAQLISAAPEMLDLLVLLLDAQLLPEFHLNAANKVVAKALGKNL